MHHKNVSFTSQFVIICSFLIDLFLFTFSRCGSQGSESVLVAANTLKDITQWRPPASRPALEVLATLATHEQETVSHILSWYAFIIECKKKNLSQVTFYDTLGQHRMQKIQISL